jgi:hypothetical protein
VIEGAGGSYDSDPAIAALLATVDEKITHYGGLSPPVRLLVHYGHHALYNTPSHGPNTERTDVAMSAARTVATQTTFERIYVPGGLRDSGEAYEIFPACTGCAYLDSQRSASSSRCHSDISRRKVYFRSVYLTEELAVGSLRSAVQTSPAWG